MAEVYKVSFYSEEIEVTVTKDSSVVKSWILQTLQTHRRRLRKLIVGIDIEWLPCFNPEESHPVALLQLCVGPCCLLFQLLHKDAVPGFLVDFLGNPNFKFVGVGVTEDAKKLLCDHRLFVANTEPIGVIWEDGIEENGERGTLESNGEAIECNIE
ncbi:uncharacterized protein LOC132612323 [Lycium barbarum]|uniref:uncharacterized protein LOC132612323 n=1 Tax=Lycium barbarum TaxID=112863 RepID=UPI00293E960E|nr:uncharacterized protein LOC132612323 [Lycium barbarum]